jgi:hypothetical protein
VNVATPHGVAVQTFCGVTRRTLAGQVTVGGCVSFTLTVNVQVVPTAAVTVTVVVPTGKNDPEAGLEVTVPQLPENVGAA